MRTTRRRIWIILRLVVLAFLIVGVVDIFILASLVFLDTTQSGTTLSRFSDPMETKIRPSYDPYEVLAGDAGFSSNLINYKRLHIDIDPNQVAASYDLYIKKDHPLFVQVEQDANEHRAAKLSDEVLGAVSVSDHALSFERVETSISDTDDSAHIIVTSAPYRSGSNHYVINVRAKQLNLPISIASKEIVVHTRGVNIYAGRPNLPVSKTQDDVRYILPGDADELYFFVEVVNPEAYTGDKLATLLEKERNVPGFDQTVYGLLEAIPFILCIFWCKRYASVIAHVRSKQEVIKAYLIFHFSYFFFYSLNDLIIRWRSPFAWAVSYFERRSLPVFGAAAYTDTNILLPLMATFLYVWPTFARTHTNATQPKTSRFRERAKQILAALLLVSLLALVGSLVSNKLGTIRTNAGLLTVAEFYLLFFSILILALYVLILLLGQATNLPRRLNFSLTLFSLLLLLIVSEVTYVYADRSGNKYLRVANMILSAVLFAASALRIVWSFAVLCYRAVASRSLHKDWRVWTAKRHLLFIFALLVVAISTRSWTWPMKYWPLWSLAWELKDLFFLVLVWFLASFLHQASAESDWLKLPDSVRNTGILLALFLFYSPTTRWNYIPVSFIAGFLLLEFWLLPKKQFDRSHLSEIKSRLKRLIKDVIALNDSEQALKTLKSELLTKLGKGEIQPQQYSEKLHVQLDAVNACREKLMVHHRFAKDDVLALGPGKSAWDNGYKVAHYSMLFAIPWTILYLRDIVRAPATGESYLLLDLVNNVVYFLLAWLSYGFIFGYFYPQIRGKNGLRKGLAMFLTIVVPGLVWTALAQPLDTANWASFGFWTLQIFVHMMLLGMITGDFFMMRSHGFRWGQLWEVHRLTFLSAWASSVILAIAAAASTLIASGATHILTSALKYVGVIPENVELPKK
ncbi:MAG TPA: DUF6185 family protein [Pyrinomonadaceae bacterium]